MKKTAFLLSLLPFSVMSHPGHEMMTASQSADLLWVLVIALAGVAVAAYLFLSARKKTRVKK